MEDSRRKDTDQGQSARTNQKVAEGKMLLRHGGTIASSWTSALLSTRRAVAASGRQKSVYLSVRKQFQGKLLELFDNMATGKEQFDWKKTKNGEETG